MKKRKGWYEFGLIGVGVYGSALMDDVIKGAPRASVAISALLLISALVLATMNDPGDVNKRDHEGV